MSLITKFITRFSSYLLKHKEKKHFTTPIKHTLTISDYLFESKASEIAIAFSEACHQNNFNTFFSKVFVFCLRWVFISDSFLTSLGV